MHTGGDKADTSGIVFESTLEYLNIKRSALPENV